MIRPISEISNFFFFLITQMIVLTYFAGGGGGVYIEKNTFLNCGHFFQGGGGDRNISEFMH